MELRTTLRKVLLRGGLFVGSLVLTFLATEMILRIFEVKAQAAPPRHVEVQINGVWRFVGLWGTAKLKMPSSVPDVKMGEYIPGRHFRFVYYDDVDEDGRPIHISHMAESRINHRGLRGADVADIKAPSTFRILFLGDSFTFGEGVQDDEPFPFLIGELLQKEAATGTLFEIVNAGVSGYNTRDEVRYLEHRGLALDPDLVVLTFYLNDAYDDMRFAELIQGQAEGELGRKPDPLSSRVIGLIYTSWSRFKVGVTELYRAQFTENPEIDGHDWEGCQEALRRAASLTRERDIGFAVVIFPELHALGGRHPFVHVYEQVAAYVRSLDIPVLDLYDSFEGQSTRDLWVHVTDHHPNADAHRIAAEAMVGFLKDTPGLLP